MSDLVPLDDLAPDQRKALPFDHPTLDAHAAAVEQANGLPAGIITAIKNAGERSGSNATSPKGARGVMQFIPATAARYGLSDPTDPLASISAAGSYLKDISAKLNTTDPRILAAAYNSGENRASLRAGQVPAIPETQAYVQRVSAAMPKPGNRAVPADDLPDAVSATNVDTGQPVKAEFVPAGDAPKAAPKAGTVANIGLGALKGASDIGATLLRPVDAALNATGITDMTNAERRQKLGQFFGENADTDSLAFKGGDLTAGVAGTAGAGGVLGKGVMAIAPAIARLLPGAANYAPKLAAALESGGFSLGNAAPATTVGGTLANAATRIAGGAAGGAAQAGMINPSDAGAGALIGGAVPVAGKLAGEAGRAVKASLWDPLANQRSLIGEAILRAVGPGGAGSMGIAATPGVRLSAGEASGNAALSAIEDSLRATNPGGALSRNAQSNRTALANALRGIAQDEGAMTAAEATRTAETTPLRDAALTNADYGTRKTGELQSRIAQKADAIVSGLQDQGRFATTAAQATAGAEKRLAPGLDVEDYSKYPILGRETPEVPALAARAAEGAQAANDTAGIVAQRKAERDFLGRQLDSLQQAGYSPLNAKGLIDGITGTLSKPGLRASDVVQKTLGEVKEKIASLADANGNLSAQDLYTVRKEIGNTISKHAKDSANWDQRLAAGLQRNLQGSMDDAIRKAGAGDLWDQYLAKYQELSKPIDQMKVGKVLADKLIPSTAGDAPTRLNAASLATLLRNPDALAGNATGFGRARLADVMTPDQLRTIQGVSGDASRIAEAQSAGAGYGSATARRQAIGEFIGQSLGEKAPVLGRIAEIAGMVPGIGLATHGLSAVGNMAAKGLNARMVGTMEDMLANDPQGVAALIQDVIRKQGAAATRGRIAGGVLRALPAAQASQATP